MDRKDILKRLLYPKCKTAIEFQFDNMIVNPMLSYITVQDIAQLNKIATSIKYSSKPKEKYMMIDKILTPRGFKKMASGTNRVVYRYLDDYRIVLKVAIDKVGLSDNGNEFRYQHLLKPFVTKCFEVSPCGTVGLFERVVPITSREEFENIAEDVFDLINNLIGKYVLEDIGEKFYMNYGLREGFGPVLLDYPYVFELDGRKLRCNVPEPLDPKGYCGGEIDYDIGYNNLICTKCGKRYLATELKSEDKSGKPKIIIEGEDIIMRCTLMRGNEVVAKLNSQDPVATDTIKPRKQFNQLKASLSTAPRNDEEKKDYYKPEIKTHDDVTLSVKLKGYPKSKDIDKEARKKEEVVERNTPKISVSFEETQIPEVKEEKVSVLRASLTLSPEVEENDITDTASTISEEAVPIENTVEVNPKDNENLMEEVKKYVEEPIENNYEKVVPKPDGSFLARIEDNGEIWNLETNELIGYSNKDCNVSYDNISKEYSESENEYESDKELTEIQQAESEGEAMRMVDETEDTVDSVIEESSETFGTNLGELITKKLRGSENENYKTNKIVSHVDQHFSAPQVKEEVGEQEPVVEEKESEIPEVIIHQRKEEDENIHLY